MRRFAQATHGETEYDQTPAAMFLEAWGAHGEPEVAMYRTTAAGLAQVHGMLRTREDVLRGVLAVVDGVLATFEQDEASTRLSGRDVTRRFPRLEFLNPTT